MADLAGMPLPWMLGAMIATTLGAMGRLPLGEPRRLRLLVIPVIGVLLGSGFTRDLLDSADDWIVTALVLPVFVVVAFACAYVVYRRLGRFDPVTAFFASAPGGLNDMMLMGAAEGGQENRIALAHASRILVVVSFVVLFYGFVLGVETEGDARPWIAFADVPAPDLLVLTICAILGAWVGPRIGLPAPQIFGPMILSGLVHVLGLTNSAPPTLAVNAAQWIIGTAVGCRFRDTPAREIVRDIALATVASSAMLACALAASLSVAWLTGVGPGAVFLAFSPGGLPEMSLLALSMGIDGAYVATAHVARIAMIISLAAIAFRLLGLKRSQQSDAAE